LEKNIKGVAMIEKEIKTRVKRTKEEIAESMKDRSICYKCGEKLKRVSSQRTSAKLCGSCRGDGKSENSQIKQIYKELKSKRIETSEDEMFFEDDPSAIKEKDYGRYISKPSQQMVYTTSALVDLMSPSNHHQYKRGSATNGTRYKYRKGQVE
jgi:hypothetical protein